jgi:hypothetical protein
VVRVIWKVGFRKNITRVISAIFKKKDTVEEPELLKVERPNSIWCENPQPVVLIDPDTGEESIDFPEHSIPERIRQILDSFLIIERTADIDTLFSRYDFILQKLEELIKYEKDGFKFDLSPKELYDMTKLSLPDLFEVVVENSYIKQLEKLLSLKTQKGKQSSIEKWRDSFSSDRITYPMMGDVTIRFEKMQKLIRYKEV